MMRNCEAVRDRLPERVAGRLDASAVRWVDAHLATCGDCTAERDLIAGLHAAPPAVPAGLERRVLRALRPLPRRRVQTGRLAMAATVVFALVTAGVLTRPSGPVVEDGAAGPAGGELADPVSAFWPRADETLLRGVPALHDLSMEELERLLKELGP